MDREKRRLLEEWEKGFGYVHVPCIDGSEASVTVFYNSRETQCEATMDFAMLDGYAIAQSCVEKLKERKEFSEVEVEEKTSRIIMKVYFYDNWDLNTILTKTLDMISGALYARKAIE